MSTIGPFDQLNQYNYPTYNTNKSTSNTDINFNLEHGSNQKEQEKKDSYVKSLTSTDSAKELYNLSTLNISVSETLKAASTKKPEDALGSAKTIGMLIEKLKSYGSTPVKYNGIPLSLDTETNVLSIGGHAKGASQIRVDNLSIGVSLLFDRDNITQVSDMLDLFSPSDINKILEAIQLDNIATNTEKEKKENTESAYNEISDQLSSSPLTLSKDVEIVDYNPNDISLGITFADKNSDTLPTIHKNTDKDKNLTTSETTTRIHTDTNGTRFLVIRTTVGEQTFEKSIKLTENL